MKRFLVLFKLEYDGVFLPLCIIAAVMSALQLALFGWRLGEAGTHAPLSYAIDTARISIVFAIAYVSMLALMTARFVRNYMPSKSIYALLTLPVKRNWVYMAKLAAALLAGFMLLAAQMVLMMIFSALMGMRNICPMGHEVTRRSADLYLALLDVGFLRMLFPPDLFSLMFSVFVFFGSICVVFYVVVGIKSGRGYNMIGIVVLWLLLMLISFPLSDYSRSNNIMKMIAMIFAVIMAVKHGTKLFVSAEVT